MKVSLSYPDHSLSLLNASSSITPFGTPIPQPIPSPSSFPSFEDVALFLAIAGNCIVVLVPLRTALKTWRKESPLSQQKVVSFIAPTYFLFGQCYMWMCYGFVTNQSDVSYFNCFGATMCAGYLAIVAIRDSCRGNHLLEVIIISAVSIVVLSSLGISLLSLPVSVESLTFAYAGIVFSILQSLSPAHLAVEAVRTKSRPNGFPYGLTIASSVSSFLWAHYAMLTHDVLYFWSNIVSGVLCLVQIFAVSWSASFSLLDRELNREKSRISLPVAEKGGSQVFGDNTLLWLNLASWLSSKLPTPSNGFALDIAGLRSLPLWSTTQCTPAKGAVYGAAHSTLPQKELLPNVRCSSSSFGPLELIRKMAGAAETELELDSYKGRRVSKEMAYYVPRAELARL